MKKKYKILLAVALVLISIRIAMPYAFKSYILKKMNTNEGYYTTIRDLDLALFRGGFKLQDVTVFEEASEEPETPLAALKTMDFSIEWKSLFKGRFVGEVYMDSLQMNFTKRDESEKSLNQTRMEFVEMIMELNPIKLNVFQLTRGEIRYLDPISNPRIDISLQDVFFQAKNLENVVDKEKALPAQATFSAKGPIAGEIDMSGALNYLKEVPDFDINFEVVDFQLAALNSLTKAKANLEVETGKLSLYSEAAAVDGKVSGYLKPIIEEMTIKKEEDDKLLQKVYKGAVQLGINLFENKKEEQVATKIELSGNLKEPETNPLQVVINVLKNAFIEAYTREIENLISFNTVSSANT